MVLAIANVVVERWERATAWLLVGFSAIAGLAVSNLERSVQLTCKSTVYGVLVLFAIVVALQVFQRLCGLFVQAAAAGGEVGKKVELEKLAPAELDIFLQGMVDAYPWPGSILIQRMLVKLKERGPRYINRATMRRAMLSGVAGMLQVVAALCALAWIGFTLHMPE